MKRIQLTSDLIHAGDIGGSIKGNKIDIFIPSKEEAVNWGKKTVIIKILD